MNSLCEAVRSEMAKAFEGVAVAEWQFKSPDSNSCAVHWKDTIIKFSVDQRDNLISSSFTFLNAAEEYQEELYSHVLFRMFPDITYNPGINSKTIQRAVATEVANVSNILRYIKKENLFPRDLFYFHSGYSCGYTDSVSIDG